MTLNKNIRPDRWIVFGAVLVLVAGFQPPIRFHHRSAGNSNNDHGPVTVVSAVDQSKFRTCEQTSFCRRHRDGHSERLYKYQIDVDSVHFHLPGEGEEDSDGESDESTKKQKDDDGDGKANNAEPSTIWRSLQDRILGGKSEDGKGRGLSDKKDPYVTGPPPTLSGKLINTATETSTASKQGETLEFTIHAMEDGLVRLRVTEVYDDPPSSATSKNHNNNDNPHSKARVTYDELVLTEIDEMKPAEHALFVRPGDTYLTETLGMTASDAKNFMGLQYGDTKDGRNGMFLLLRIDSFTAYLYRESNISLGPVIAMGDKGQTHFEIRRTRNDEEDESGDVSGDDSVKDSIDSDQEDESGEDGEKKDTDGKPEKEIVGYWEDGLAIYADGTREERKVEEDDHRQLTEQELDREGLWEEKFQSHHDSKPHGPMSVGSDFTFPRSKHVFGLPEHASSTSLKRTVGEGAEYQHPYRLYNLDVFEYDLDVPMALYGAVPLLVSQSKEAGTAGVFWFNPTETFIDINDDHTGSKTSHWMSESGIIDVFFIPGPTPADLYRQYASLTGKMPLPPMFSLGYHQCRWNYKDEQDVSQVHGKFEELDYPYDVLWLDIEHTDGKRYFTWDKNLFPHPEDMQEKLWSQGRRMVTIVDPHVKRDDNYYIHTDATSKGLYVKDKDGTNDYDGWCWPGSSSYLDFTNERARSWWADQFSYDRYQGSTPSLFTWNDMNEPSVFNGPEVSMQKDLKNLNGEEHREWHNLYGMLFQRSTMEGLVRRNDGENVRPFVLSRAFFAGSQKYGSIWTGDNAAEWSHLEIASPMLLSLNVGALSFVGADVGGFFGNTDAELMTRWMQAGAYQPFFRGHAHHDAKRREPWMFGDETLVLLRKAAMARYALLPYWYTIFQEAEESGMPVMRTMWMNYPETEILYPTDDQFLIGTDLLVKPVTAPGVIESVVLFPEEDIWYDAETLQMVSKQGRKGAVREVTVPSPLDKIPVFQRGGSIVARKLRLRRSSFAMMNDPYTLYIALDPSGFATGRLYMDDETTFNHMLNDEFASADFTTQFDGKVGYIRNAVTIGDGWKSNLEQSTRMVERIIIMGVKDHPKSIEENGESLGFTHDSIAHILVLRKPELSALSPWEIKISF